jgi:hypothetical protein
MWVADRGWWLHNVEFQPSGFTVGSYLNVGLQHLWDVQDSRSFGYFYREPIDGAGQFVEFAGDEAAIQTAANTVAKSARRAVERQVREVGDGTVHLRWLAQRPSSGGGALNAAIAVGLLGDLPGAQRMLGDLASRMDRTIGWQEMFADDCLALAAETDQHRFTTVILDRITRTRALLKLEPAFDTTALLPST